jgi:hypothetical protein
MNRRAMKRATSTSSKLNLKLIKPKFKRRTRYGRTRGNTLRTPGAREPRWGTRRGRRGRAGPRGGAGHSRGGRGAASVRATAGEGARGHGGVSRRRG